MERIAELLNKLGIPFAYDHFAEGESPDPPFVCYRVPNTENFGADGVVYFGINVVDIELYTDFKSLETEKKLEDLLTEYGIFYEKNEAFIELEKLYEVLYEFEEEA
jgi:hypothetical protein